MDKSHTKQIISDGNYFNLATNDDLLVSSSSRRAITVNENTSRSTTQLTNLDKKLLLIEKEIKQIDPEHLVMYVDPSQETSDLIDQVQKYTSLIQNEINIIRSQNTNEKEIEKQIANNQKKLRELKRGQPQGEIGCWKAKITPRGEDLEYKRSKPKMDYRIVINSLENEIVLLGQKIMNSKAVNNEKSKEIEEIRKKYQINRNKLKEITKCLQAEEKEFIAKKKASEMNLSHSKSNSINNSIRKPQR